MDSSLWSDTKNLNWSIVYIEGSHVIIVFLSLKIVFASANSVDAKDMPHYVAFHRGLHCLPKKAFRSH